MRINEKTLLFFANSKPSDKEGYLMKRGEVNKSFQRRWFVLKGNLLFYFEKKGGDLLGFIILEGCVIELAEAETENFCFNINFLGNRSYVLSGENQDSLESWMRALTCSGFDYMKLMVNELQRQLDELDKAPGCQSHQEKSCIVPPIPPRRQNPFNNKSNGNSNMQQVVFDDSILLRPAPPPPTNRSNFEPDRDTGRFELIRDDNEFFMPVKSVDFSFKTIHEEFGQPILLAMKERKALKESADKPLIQF